MWLRFFEITLTVIVWTALFMLLFIGAEADIHKTPQPISPAVLSPGPPASLCMTTPGTRRTGDGTVPLLSGFCELTRVESKGGIGGQGGYSAGSRPA